METWIVRFVWNGPFLMCKIFKLAITKFHQYKCWSSYHFYVVILQHWNLSFHSFMRAFSIIHTFAISNDSSFHFIVLLHLIFYVHFDKNIFTMIQLAIHPSSSHKWNSCPNYLIHLELYLAVQFSEFVFVEIFFLVIITSLICNS